MKITHIYDADYRNWVLGASHPTQGRRYAHAAALLEAISASAGIDIETVASREATTAELSIVHSDAYIDRVLNQHDSGAWVGADPQLARLASMLYGGTMVAVEQVLAGALNVVHLPGAKHHALADRSSGFCVFADFAGAATVLNSVHAKKVGILDIDVHHGDGTEALCRDNSQILTFSIHQGGIFPFTGSTREDDHQRRVYNRPLEAGNGDRELLTSVREFVGVCKEFQPDVVMIAGGADGHAKDTLGSLEYSIYGFNRAVGLVRDGLPEKPIIFGGAGGYRPDDYTPMMWVSAVCALAGLGADVVESLNFDETLAAVRSASV